MNSLNGVQANVETRERERLEGMKSMKGRIVKKLNSISTIHSLKQGFLFRTTSLSNQYFQTSSPPKECEKDNIQSELVTGGRIDQSEIIKDVEDDALVPGKCDDEKAEDFRPPLKSEEDAGSALDNKEELQLMAESAIDEKCETDCQSGGSAVGQLNQKNVHQSPSDSTLVACFKLRDMEESKMIDANDLSELLSSLQGFEERCPPGGSESIVLYTTSMRGIRKTFEDCTSIRFLLESFRVEYHERDVAMHLEYREELWRVMGQRVVPPRLFIRGRYIGGADEVIGLHERGMLRKLLQGIPLTPNNSACTGCAGVKFVLCFNCNGSRKIIAPDDGPAIRCSECNENGLVKCPICGRL